MQSILNLCNLSDTLTLSSNVDNDDVLYFVSVVITSFRASMQVRISLHIVYCSYAYDSKKLETCFDKYLKRMKLLHKFLDWTFSYECQAPEDQKKKTKVKVYNSQQHDI